MRKRLYIIILLLVSLFFYIPLKAKDLLFKDLNTLQFRIIVVKSKKEADEIVSELKKGAPFYKLAKDRSMGPNVRNGGYIGRIKIEDIAPAYLKELVNLKEGYYSRVIKTSKGYTIFQRTTDRYFRNGIEAFLKSDYDRAIGEFKKDISINPDNLNSYKYLSIIFEKKKFFNKAIDMNNKIIDINPDDYEAYNNLGNIFMKMGLYKEAQKSYKKGINIAPDNDIIYNNLAWLYSSFKTNIDEGISLAKRAIELNPNVAAYHDTLGELYYQKGLYSKAIGEMRIALWLEPDNKDFKDRLKKIKNNYKEELNKNTKAKKSNIEPTILVLNGNGIRNSAKIMAKTLRKMGYNVCAIKNAKRFNYIRTIILYKKPFTKTAINIGHRLKGIQEIYRLKEKSEYDIWVIVGKK